MCYKALVDALLKNKTQTFLVTRLNKEFEKKKIRLHSKILFLFISWTYMYTNTNETKHKYISV